MTTFKTAFLGSVAAIAFSIPALAQTAPASDTTDSDEVSVQDTITVTTSRREESLQDVPASVVAVDPEAFTLTGKTTIQDVIRYSPGLFFNDQGNRGRGTITARGIPQAGTTPVFATYVDDSPLTSNTPYNQGAFINLDGLLLDVERVEIVKGPQGTLFGATSVGGLLRYITRDPSLDEFRATIGADYHSVSDGGSGSIINGRVSLPIVKDRLGVTLSAYQEDTAGYTNRVDPATGATLEEDIGSTEIEGYAADVLFRANENLDISVKYLLQKNSADDDRQVNLAGTGSTDGLFGDFDTINQNSFIDIETELIAADIEYDFGWATFNSTTSQSTVKQDIDVDLTTAFGGFIDLFTGQAPGTTTNVTLISPLTTEKFVQEFRLTSAENEKLEWLAGVYYAKEEGTNQQETIETPTPPVEIFIADFPSSYEELAAFGNLTYYFNDKFDVTVGARITDNEVTFDFFTDGLLTVGFGPAVTVDQSIEDTVTTYLASLRYRPTDDLSLYARAASGYRGPAPNFVIIDALTGTPATPPALESDEVWSFEVGAKGSKFDGRFDYDVSLWSGYFDNFQSTFSVNGVAVLGNAVDGLEAYGFDAAFTLNATENLTFDANLGYAISELNSDEPGFGGVAGEQIPGVPKWKASLLFNYNKDITPEWTANLGGGIRYTDEITSNFAFTTTLADTIEDRTIADLNLSLSNGQVQFGVYATNLFDERALVSRDDSIVAFDPTTGAPITSSTGTFERPRTIGANIKVDF